MREIIISVAMSAMVVAVFVLYFVMMNTVLPRFLLKMKTSVGGYLGRGLGKYTYQGGRGISYELHPSLRKYVKKYVLFTNEGYKYLSCLVGHGVVSLSYSIVMLNRKNKVIDVLDVDETVGISGKTAPVLLHHETSYVALLLKSVNGARVKTRNVFYYTLSGTLAYALAVTVLGFAVTVFASEMLETLVYKFSGIHYLLCPEAATFILPALVIGVLCTTMMLHRGRKKGISVRLK